MHRSNTNIDPRAPRYVPLPKRPSLTINTIGRLIDEEEGRPLSATSNSSFVSQLDPNITINALHSGHVEGPGASGSGSPEGGEIPIGLGSPFRYHGDYGQSAVYDQQQLQQGGYGAYQAGGLPYDQIIASGTGAFTNGHGTFYPPGPSLHNSSNGQPAQGGHNFGMTNQPTHQPYSFLRQSTAPSQAPRHAFDRRDTIAGGENVQPRSFLRREPVALRDNSQIQDFLRREQEAMHYQQSLNALHRDAPVMRNASTSTHGPASSGPRHQAAFSSSSGSDTAVNTIGSGSSESSFYNPDDIENMSPRQLAALIRAGYCDPGDVDDSDPLSFNPKQSAPTVHTTMAGMSKHLGPKVPVDAKLDLQHKGNTAPVYRGGNLKGNSVAYFGNDALPLPAFFADLPRGYVPTAEQFFMAMPAMEACRVAAPSIAAVVRIRNIPYDTPRAQIIAFVGASVQLLPQPPGTPWYGVHVIMERGTAKTMDAFVEFARPEEAVFVLRAHERRMMQQRPSRIGTREVLVEPSSQEDLMAEMFPRAKHVVWEGNTPRIVENTEYYFPGEKAMGFTGFLQNEEMVNMVKHAEVPHRTPQAKRHLARVYESQISTLHKYPWFAVDCIYMTERRMIYDATVSMMSALMRTLRKIETGGGVVEPGMPTQATLQELIVAALTCPGFSEVQKAELIKTVDAGGYGHYTTSRGMNITFGGTRAISSVWPFRVLVITPGAQDELIEYFRIMVRDATMGGKTMTLAQKHALRAAGGNIEGPFGALAINYGTAKTVGEAGMAELNAIEDLLTRVLRT